MSEGDRAPVEVRAPAKLTLSLRVTGVRADGYHLLESEMVALDLADTLLIEDGDGLTVATEPSEGVMARRTGSIPTGPENLVARALVATGRTARVHVVKRIPPGAGLGGGSADAAAVLRWAGCGDVAAAAGLGADVPFCVAGGRAMVRGIGELVEELPFEERQFMLLLLPFGMDTAAVYRAWDELSAPRRPAVEDAVVNDLQEAALEVEPRLDRWRLLFEVLTGHRPHLAGSGSTWFIEGSPESVGVADGQVLTLGEEQAVVVAVRTVPPSG
jgi:4-diphosphocytidyl-2-C-methyl-D-erythritol kinase